MINKNLIIILLVIGIVGLFLNRKLDQIEFENRQRIAHVPVQSLPTDVAVALEPTQDIVAQPQKSPDVDITINNPPNQANPQTPDQVTSPVKVQADQSAIIVDNPQKSLQITMPTPQIVDLSSSPRYGNFVNNGIGAQSVSAELTTVYSATKTILVSLGIWSFLRAVLTIMSVLSIVWTILRYLKS